MEFGILSILPPLIAIVLALWTKEVISSLLVGIFAGSLIFTGGNLLAAAQTVFSLMSSKIADNGSMLIFLGLLGSLVVVVTKAGGSRAYGDWASSKIRSKTGAQLSTAVLGMLIFIDDYFNCLTVGTVMRPITDKYQVSRAKLAYFIDSTAAPVCIIAPISSWAASVISTIGDVGVENPMNMFISTIPFNLYALFTLLTVLYFSMNDHDYGPMKKFEQNDTSRLDQPGEASAIQVSDKGTVLDLIIPILVLIVSTVSMMLYTGGMFGSESAGLAAAFGNADVNQSLIIGAFIAMAVSFALFIPRRLLSFSDFMESINEGIKSMVPAMLILILAWSIGGICNDEFLNTGGYVGHLIQTSQLPIWVLPAVVFLCGGMLAFSTGTAWGTFGILVPILVPIVLAIGAQTMMPVILAAIFSGSVFGDHCSPISDTTILSSAGANCRHIDHVASQLPYALTVGAAAFVGFIAAGLTNNLLVTLLVTLVVLAGIITFMRTRRTPA